MGMTYFSMVASDRTPKPHVERVMHKSCPMGCGYTLARVAERMIGEPYNWQPFGYRCTRCNAIYWDSEAIPP